MSTTGSILCSGITKIYPNLESARSRIRYLLGQKGDSHHAALRDVSFEVRPGETVGILGKNGSGKSTLLKVLTGVSAPEEGQVKVHGEVSALLELGSGLNPKMTGIENIKMALLLEGVTPSKIDEATPEIIEFSELGDAIYRRVSTYSSGMFVRLAFAISIHADPDILIVDEALAVGDLTFQMKCYARLDEFKKRGKTLILVSHDLQQIIRHCDRAIVLNQGELIADTSAKEAIDVYKKLLIHQDGIGSRELTEQQTPVMEGAKRYGDGKASIQSCQLFDSKGVSTDQLAHGEEYTIELDLEFHQEITLPIFAFTIKDVSGLEISGMNTELETGMPTRVGKDQKVRVRFRQKLNLQQGGYTLSVAVVSKLAGELHVHDRLYDLLCFEVVSMHNFVGFYSPLSHVEVAHGDTK